MLIQFSVGNYRSFNEVVTLSMVSASFKEHINSHVFQVSNLSFLKSVVIYGANASGKSNLFKAIGFMRNFIMGSAKDMQAGEYIPVERFLLSTETVNLPSYFEMLFLVEGIKYRYGFEVTEREVINEWLFFSPNKREVKLFKRENQKIVLGNRFSEGHGLEEKTRTNALFLSVVAQFNGEKSGKVLKWFTDLRVMSGLKDEGFSPIKTIEEESFLDLIRVADLGIEKIEVEKKEWRLPELPQEIISIIEQRGIELSATIEKVEQIEPRTIHKVFGKNKELVSYSKFSIPEQESDGTQRLFVLLFHITDVLKNGGVLVVDEFDARLHTLISRFLIRMFNSVEKNPNNAQLVINTHDTNLLDRKVFRRDQIWLTEKDKYQQTDLYSIAEYQVRNDASFEKDYLQGKYGAIPFVGDFHFYCEDGGDE